MPCRPVMRNMKKESEVDNVPFLFTKTELGRLISRNVIRIMYFCYYDTKTIELDEKETKIVKIVSCARCKEKV